MERAHEIMNGGGWKDRRAHGMDYNNMVGSEAIDFHAY